MAPLSARVLFLALALALATAQDPSTSSLSEADAEGVEGATFANQTIYDTIAASERHQVFKALIDLPLAAGLKDEFTRISARLTVLAPPDNAFFRLARRVSPGIDFDTSNPGSVVGALATGFQLIANNVRPTEVMDVLSYHVLRRDFYYSQLENTTKPTRIDAKLSFENGVILDRDDAANASVVRKDMLRLNGWLHLISDVLLPFQLERVLAELTPSPSPSPSPTLGTSPPPATVTPRPSSNAEVAEDDPDSASATDDDDPTSSDDDSDDADPESTPDDDEVCFPAGATLARPDGAAVRMDAVHAGDAVRHGHSVDAHSPIFLFTHRQATARAVFLSVSTSCAATRPLELSPRHYVYANGGALTAARSLRAGDVLEGADGECVVKGVRRVVRTGVFAPHSLHGDLVVDGIRVSSYSQAVHPSVAHALLAPVRLAVRWAGFIEPLGGTLYGGADWVLPFVPSGSEKY